MKSKLFIVSLLFITAGCLPKDSIQLRDVKNLMFVSLKERGIQGDAVFFNPNSSRMKLRHVEIEAFIDGEKSAAIDQDSKVVAKPNSEFTIPVFIKLEDNFDLMSLLGGAIKGKRYEIHYKGHLKVNVNGFPVRIPVDHTEQLRLPF